jgi:hypothetical protein
MDDEEKLSRQAFAALRPGEWFEIAELILAPLDNDVLRGILLQSWAKYMKVSRIYDSPSDKHYKYEKWMKEAGFGNVEVHFRDIALHADEGELKDLGEHQQDVLREEIEGFSLQMCVSVLGWSKGEVDVCLAQVGKELASSKVKASCRWIHVFGQKSRSPTCQPASLSENSVQLLDSPPNTQTPFTSSLAYRQRVLSNLKWTNQAKSTHAPSFSNETWTEHQSLIQQKSTSDATTREILKSLQKNGFSPTVGQLRRQMKKWGYSPTPRKQMKKAGDYRHFNPSDTSRLDFTFMAASEASSSLRNDQILEAASKYRQSKDAQAPYTERAPPLSITPSTVGFHGICSPSPPKHGNAILARNVCGKKGPLPSGVAADASEIRDRGACLKCRLFRNKCDGNDPCSECCKTAHNWNFGCIRERLADRVHRLFPKILLAKIQQGNNEIATSKDPPFYLALAHKGSERQLYLHVHTVRSWNQTIIVPYWNKDGEQQDLVQTLRNWLDGVTEDSNFSREEFFKLLTNHLWEQKVLAEVYDHVSRTEKGRRRLQQALRLRYLAFVLKNPFTSLADKARLENIPELGTYKMSLPQVSPLSATNLMASVCAYFKLLVAENLKNLDALLMSRNGIEATEAAFCEAFLCLISLGQCQNSVLNHDMMTFSTACDQIRLLENDFIKYIIELFVCKFRKQAVSQAKECSSASSLSPFFDRLLQIISARAQDFCDQTELGLIDPGTFDLRNVSRLLSQLCHSVSDSWVLPYQSKACQLANEVVVEQSPSSPSLMCERSSSVSLARSLLSDNGSSTGITIVSSVDEFALDDTPLSDTSHSSLLI